jgi:hypothetical protein
MEKTVLTRSPPNISMVKPLIDMFLSERRNREMVGLDGPVSVDISTL